MKVTGVCSILMLGSQHGRTFYLYPRSEAPIASQNRDFAHPRFSLAPAIAALALFAFVYHWNSYLWPLTVLQGNAEDYPIVISLSRLLSYNRGALNTGLVMAGATLAVLPPLMLFAFLQRFFVDSIVGSAVKG
ncbi:hypothetical protein NKI48_21200 [Mesorhizobium sp. M0644]|uniref:hypothetical protein n=2 Tax=unclassified Mesorhizobium TaxID=325217 RepID=UPI00333D0AA0